MGNEPLGRYGRKPFLPLFSFFSRGRGRYAVLAAALALASLPLAVPGPMFEGFLGFPPVAAILRLAGAGNGADRSVAGAAAGLLRVEAGGRDGYAAYGRGRSRACGADCRNPSPLDMVKADMSALTARVPPGRIAGALDPSGAEGQAEAVDLGRPGGGRAAGGTPYRGGALAGSGVIGRGDGLYSSALRYGGSMVPPPGRPQRVGSGYTGRASSLSWRDLRRNTEAAEKIGGFSDKRPMSQLVQAFSSGERAAGTSPARPESRAVYAGAVYNGGDMDMEVMAEEVPAFLPAFGSVDDGDAARNMKELTKKCARAQSSSGEAMYSIGREMDELQAGMSSPPSCGGNVAPWNAKVARLYRLCLQFNRNQAELAKACQSSGGGMNCEMYAADRENDGLIVKKCGSGPLSGVAAVLSVPAALAAAAFSRLKPD